MRQSGRNLADRLQTLSAEQAAEVEAFIDFLSFRAHEREIAHTAEAASQPVFDAIWSNPEDDAYDAL